MVGFSPHHAHRDRAAVREAVAAEDSDAGRIDWGIRAATHPELRWDGLHELASLSTPLTRAQQQRLARSFISARCSTARCR